MTIHRCFAAALLCLMTLSFVPLASAQEEIHWTYEGEEGPNHWGELKPEYALCGTGKNQSPIDLTTVVSANINDIAFNYTSSALNIFNNGHTVQVKYDSGSSITYNGVQYNLDQFHFHTPSEHTDGGEAAPMEVHFVHFSDTGAAAVVGVILLEGEADNPAYASIFDNLPAEESDPTTLDATIFAADMLPESKTYLTYTGSLTTPPCTEGIRWLLLDTPVELSAAQIEAFRSIFELNARPIQPQNARDVIHDSGAD